MTIPLLHPLVFVVLLVIGVTGILVVAWIMETTDRLKLWWRHEVRQKPYPQREDWPR